MKKTKTHTPDNWDALNVSLSLFLLHRNVLYNHNKNIVKRICKKEMYQSKEYYKKCLICGINEWIEKDDENGHSIVCNMCGFTNGQ